MQKLSNRYLPEALAYVRQEPEFNLFCIGDLEQLGMEDENMACYTSEDWRSGMMFPYFILNYRGNFIVYSHEEGYDAEAVGRFLAEINPRNISGKDRIARKLLPYLKDKKAQVTCMARLNEVTREQRDRAGDLMGRVKRLGDQDIPAIYEFYQQIDEFAYTYREKSREECYEDIRFNVSVMGRSYGILEEGRLVSIAQTAAENSTSAMVVGVATHPAKRRKGYARATVLALCRDCLEAGMDFLCLFYSNPAAGAIYHAIGFEDLGRYTMIRDQKETVQ